MALTVTTSAIPSFGCQIKCFKAPKYPFCRCPTFSRVHNYQISLRCSTRAPTTTAGFSEPSKLKLHVDNFREKLWEAFPESAKEFPWKKSKDIMLQRLFVLGEKALKWSLITLFIISSLSDIILAILRNWELIIPLGLFVGCMMADFLKETCQELFKRTKEGGLNWHLVGIGSFFVLVKFVSLYFTMGTKMFLSHVGNGGLMQVLWLWRKSQEERERHDEITSSSLQDAFVNNVKG